MLLISHICVFRALFAWIEIYFGHVSNYKPLFVCVNRYLFWSGAKLQTGKWGLFDKLSRMGWVWEDDAGEANTAGDVTGFQNPNLRSEDRCSTRTIVKSQCRTEEVKPGKFVRKCQKTQQILKDCVGRYLVLFVYLFFQYGCGLVLRK